MDADIFVSWPPLTGRILVVAVILFLLYDFWCHTYWWRHGKPFVPAWPIVSNMVQISAGANTFQLINQNIYGSVYGIYHYRQPGLVCGDLELVKTVFVRSYGKFQNRKMFTLYNQEVDASITNIRGSRWRAVRKSLVTAFSTAKLNEMSKRVGTHADRLVKNVTSEMENTGHFDCRRLFGLYVLDLFGSCCLDVKLGAQENPDMANVKNAESATCPANVEANPDFSYSLQPGVILSGIFPWMSSIFYLLKIGSFPLHTIRFFREITMTVVANRLTSHDDDVTKPCDLIQHMLNTRMSTTTGVIAEDVGDKLNNRRQSSSKINMTDVELIAQTATFFLAGFKGTRTTMMCAALLLASHPDKQDKLLQEIDQMVPLDQELNFKFASKLPYLHQVLCETLRMYPPAARTSRECSETFTYRDITIPKGMQVLIPITAIHYNPDYWPEPEKFIPERFTKDASDKRHPFAWLPFGEGPRKCFGFKLAFMMVKIGLLRLLQRFQFERCNLTPDMGNLGKTPFLVIPDVVPIRVVPRIDE